MDQLEAPEGGLRPEYEVVDGGIQWNKRSRDGNLEEVRLTNFVARLLRHVVVDDGLEQQKFATIEASCAGGNVTFTISAKAFNAMAWVSEQLGARAIIEPGWDHLNRVRVAIQHLSGRVPEVRHFRHVGWTRLPGGWHYLTAGGAIGPAGLATDVAVEPPDSLRPMLLPAPETGDALAGAVQASLRLLDVGQLEVTLPACAGVYRAPLGACDFSLFLAGPTGQFKTAFAVTLLQHWGAGFDSAHVPASWTATENALEEQAFLTKDALLLIDDFVPKGGPEGARTLHAKAERVLRAAANRSGRGRMRSDITMRPVRPPRGLILSTGEEIPEGQSLRARVVICEVSPGAIASDRLSQAQRDASRGLHAAAMSGYLTWLAPRLDALREAAPTHVAQLARPFESKEGHRRAARAAGELLNGLWTFLAFAQEVGAIDAPAASVLWARAQDAMGRIVRIQVEHQRSESPVDQFLSALQSALVSGHANVTSLDGQVPLHAEALGWRVFGDALRSSGVRVGWTDGVDLFLDSKAALMVARRMDPRGVTISEETLVKRLHESGKLASSDDRGGKRRHRVRRTLGGQRIPVLHLLLSSVVEVVAQVDQDTAANGDGDGEGIEDGELEWRDPDAEDPTDDSPAGS